MNWIEAPSRQFFPVFLVFFCVLIRGTNLLFVQDVKDDGSLPRSSRSAEPSIDNSNLIERTLLLEQALQQTLEALSVKLGRQPFDDIMSSLRELPGSSRHGAEKVDPEITNLLDSKKSNGIAISPETNKSMHIFFM